MPIQVLINIFSKLLSHKIKKNTQSKKHKKQNNKSNHLNKKTKKKSPKKMNINNQFLHTNIRKFNPLNFDDSYFNTVYFPQVKKIERETGLEEKFGGMKPFFKKGEIWPTTQYLEPLVFICQFKDPRKNNNNLIRVFLDKDLIEWESFEHYEGYPLYKGKPFISKINLDKYKDLQDKNITFPLKKFQDEIYENQKKPSKYKIIPQSKNQIKKEIEEEFIMPCYKITSWKKDKELKYYEEIYLKLYGKSNSVNSFNQELYDKYENSKYAPSMGIKVGGTPQAIQDEEIVKDYKLLQLTNMPYSPFLWADEGIAHINDKLELYFDSS